MTAPAAPPSLRFAILGTAGHIDHGKSSLVKALTGTDPDRLPEEKARGMTIELGFAHLDLPGVRLGLVDVPGHERFVRTMVAGATGIDVCVLVVAADDGVMPQTREHVEILDLLGVARGVVALSKADLVSRERIEDVGEHVRTLTAGTLLADWPRVAVSAVRGDGLGELKARLAEIVASAPPREASSIFRMAIDRVFAVRGRGTVVTGSVLQGAAAAGDALELLPIGAACKVREIQTHGESAERIRAGQRAALNLTGVDREQIERGYELATPAALTPTRYMDARVWLSSRLERPLPSHRRVRVCMGTREELATLVCLDGAEIRPGQSGLAQLRFARPMTAAHGQRLILRDETAQMTLGGGAVLRAVSRRLKAGPDEAAATTVMEGRDSAVRVGEVLRQAGFSPLRPGQVAVRAGVEPATAQACVAEMRKAGALVAVGTLEVHADVVRALHARAADHLKRHHARCPNEPGVLTDRLVGWLERRSATGLGRTLFASMQAAELVVVRGPYSAHRDFRPALSAEESVLLERLVAEINTGGLDPPEWPALKVLAGLSKARVGVLTELARSEPRLVQVAPERYLSAGALERFRETVRRLGAGGRRFKLAEVRDALQLSRRAVQPILEHFDRVGLTRRVGDERVLIGDAR